MASPSSAYLKFLPDCLPLNKSHIFCPEQNSPAELAIIFHCSFFVVLQDTISCKRSPEPFSLWHVPSLLFGWDTVPFLSLGSWWFEATKIIWPTNSEKTPVLRSASYEVSRGLAHNPHIPYKQFPTTVWGLRKRLTLLFSSKVVYRDCI